MKSYALGIDIGGTKIAAALVTATGDVSHRLVVATPAADGARAVLRTAVEVAQQVQAEAAAEGVQIAAAGVGSAGHVDRRHGRISYASELLRGWTGLELAREMDEALGLPVAVENDVNAMAIGESHYGSGQDVDDALYITVGTGIGGAVVANGRVRHGATWTAGEIGHLVVDLSGSRRCNCGRSGHLEAYAAGPAMASRYCELARVDGQMDFVSVAQRARDGDRMAAATVAEGARILGVALGGVLNVLDPQALIVGGGVAAIDDLWWPSLEAAIRDNPMPGPAAVSLRRAALGVDAVLIGAAWLALAERTLKPAEDR